MHLIPDIKKFVGESKIYTNHYRLDYYLKNKDYQNYSYSYLLNLNKKGTCELLKRINTRYSRNWLGYCHEYGIGVKKDFNKGISLYQSHRFNDMINDMNKLQI